MEISHQGLIKDLESSLEKYMKGLPESPLVLPVKTKIIIDRKNVNIDHLSFYPADSTDKLYEIVKNYFINLGDEIVFNDSAFLIIRNDLKVDINSELNNKECETVMARGSKFLSTGLTHGDVIQLKGNFSLRSEAPKECLSYKFEEKHLNSIVNYFSCETCRLNCK